MTDEVGIAAYTETNYIVQPQREAGFYVLFRQWDRLREKVKTMPQSSDFARNLGWVCVGIAGGSIVALLPWIPAYAQLGDQATKDYRWVTPALAAIAIGSAVVSRLAFWMDSQTTKMQAWASSQIVGDMDAISARYPRTVPTPAPAPMPTPVENQTQPGTFDPDEIPF